ncbi:MAG: STAS/SEC14 domain-containing protein [Gallionella sp.]
MITIQQTPHLVNVAVMGEFTLADFKQFEEQVVYELKTPGTVNLLFDLRAMLSVSIDTVWEEIKFFSQAHHYDFNKIAVVTEDQWLTWEAILSRLFVEAQVEVFSDYPTAEVWIAA